MRVVIQVEEVENGFIVKDISPDRIATPSWIYDNASAAALCIQGLLEAAEIEDTEKES